MNAIYSIEAGELVIRNGETNREFWRGKIMGQSTVKLASLPNDDAVVLIEAGTKDHPIFANLLRITDSGAIKWSASPISSHDSFVAFDLEAEELRATTWNGSRVTLNMNNGEIISEQFVK